MDFKNLTVTKKVLGLLVGVSTIFIILLVVGRGIYIPQMEKDKYNDIAKNLQLILNKEIALKKEVGSSNIAGIASNDIIPLSLEKNDRKLVKDLFKSIGTQYKANTNFKNIQLHLHTSDLKSFYRSWKPKRFGDNIEFRKIVKKVNQEKKAYANMALTGKGLSMIAVVPIIRDGIFLGTIEFIQGLNSVQKSLKKNQMDFLLLMDKAKLTIAQQIKTPVIVGNYVLNQKAVDKDFLEVAKKLAYSKLLKDGYIITKDHFITSEDIFDSTGEHVGIYLISKSIKDANIEIENSKDMINVFFAGVMLLIIAMISVTAITFYIFATRPIVAAVQTMVNGGEEVISASNEIASSATMLAESSSNQAASVEKITATIEQTSSTIQQTADNSKEADTLSNDASQAAKEGYEYIKKLLVSMEEITGSSKEIANIIKTIDEIAFQTNLLALNAAVEAARAGEHGLGFAVVAEEVRNLAGKSANAAKETAVIIDNSLTQVNNGNKIASETNKAFEDILEKVNKSSALITEISMASKEQTEGMQQINKAMEQIDEVTQTVASTSEESAAASEELNAQAITMGETVKSIGLLVGYEVNKK